MDVTGNDLLLPVNEGVCLCAAGVRDFPYGRKLWSFWQQAGIMKFMSLEFVPV
jgi:hypothetical protein